MFAEFKQRYGVMKIHHELNLDFNHCSVGAAQDGFPGS
ncbi:hypothetical protein [Lactiplantibacillus plantarum]